MKEKANTTLHSERAELIHKLRAYYEHMEAPRRSNRKDEMLRRIYSRWSMLNLSKRIISRLGEDMPEDLVQDYMDEMAQYMKMCKIQPNIFACGFEVANKIWVRMVNEAF